MSTSTWSGRCTSALGTTAVATPKPLGASAQEQNSSGNFAVVSNMLIWQAGNTVDHKYRSNAECPTCLCREAPEIRTVKSTPCVSKKNKTFHRKALPATFHTSTNLFDTCGHNYITPKQIYKKYFLLWTNHRFVGAPECFKRKKLEALAHFSLDWSHDLTKKEFL